MSKVLGMHYSWLYSSEDSRLLIDVDTLTLGFRLYVSSDKSKVQREDFAPGELTHSETFNTEPALMNYTHRLRLEINADRGNYVQVSSTRKEIVTG